MTEERRIDGGPVAIEDYQMVRDAQPGDRVTFINRFSQIRSGKVVIKVAAHLVLNAGGKHGTPAVVDHRNIVSLRQAR